MDSQNLPVKYTHQQLHQIPITGAPIYTGGMQITGGEIHAGGIPISGGPVYKGGMPITGGEVYAGGIPITGGLAYTGGMHTGGIPISGGPVYQGGMPITGGEIHAGGIPISGGPVYQGGMPITGGEVYAGGIPISGGPAYTGGMPITGGEIHTGGIPISGGPVYQGGMPITGGELPVGGIPITGGPVYTGVMPITGGEMHTGGIPITGGQPIGNYPPPLNHQPGYCEEIHRNRPQYNSISAGSLMLIISGMHIGWTIWRLNFFFLQDRWYSPFANIHLVIFTTTTWFVMAIVGSLLGSLIVPLLKKKIIYWGCSTGLALSSLIMIIWYDQIEGIIVARLIAGAAHGVIYVVLLEHAAENAEQRNRGCLISSLNLMLMTGTFLFAVFRYSLTINATITVDRLVGIIGLLLSALAALMATFFTYESVPYLLRIGNDRKALHNMMRLRTESVETMKVHQDLQEMRLMVSEDKLESRNILTKSNCQPLMLMTAIKMMAFCGNNWLLNIIQIRIVAFILLPASVDLAPIILTVVRFVMSFVATFVADLMPRKLMLAISGASTGLVLLVMGILEVSVTQRTGAGAYALLVFCVLLQVTVAFGIDPLQHILMSEAFSLRKKTWSITSISVLENTTHILAIIIFMNSGVTTDVMIAIPFVAAVVIAVLTPILYFTMPETVGMTLRETRDAYSPKKQRAVAYSRENNNRFQVA